MFFKVWESKIIQQKPKELNINKYKIIETINKKRIS